MKAGRRKLALLATILVIALPTLFAAGGKKEKQTAFEMDEQKRSIHALNRLTFGARPGDVAHVNAMGVDAWIDQQLHPETIDDDALTARLAPLRTLQMTSNQIVQNFPPPQVIQAIANGKRSLPSDPTQRAVYLAELDRFAERQERKQEAARNVATTDGQAQPEKLIDNDASRRDEDRSVEDEIQNLLAMRPDQRANAVLRMQGPQRREVIKSLKGKREQFLEGMSPEQRELIMALNNPQQVVVDELVENKLLRATYSERQLQEVMTDFWFNHFNVFIGKGDDHYLLTSYERDVIRPHAFGKFEDLLVATAQSPAMLFYLDNWLSVGPNSDTANGMRERAKNKRAKNNTPVRQAKGKRNGLNENYGRELMELHTLGVNGGYTQKDVTEVARVFTGWTLTKPADGTGFVFDERMHEPGDKYVLGHRIKYKGQKEGLEVLHILAHHPSTARFVCTKLAVRFVSDNPPPALVDRMAQTFLKKDGDLREVLKTMLNSPEFWQADMYRAKVKTPLEFTVSALRASGAEIDDAMPLARQLQNMGMPLYGAQPPTGYSSKAETWVSSSALLGRMNFALALTGGRLRGTQVDPDLLLENGQPGSPGQALAILEDSLLAGDISKQTHDVIAARLEDAKISQRRLDDPARSPNVAAITGLLLGSPEFQRR